MKKMQVRSFRNSQALADFVNNQYIFRDYIQAIVGSPDVGYTLFWWER